MSTLVSRVSSGVSACVEELSALYTTLGVNHADRDALMAMLEQAIMRACNEAVSEAKDGVRQIREEIDAIQAQTRTIRAQIAATAPQNKEQEEPNQSLTATRDAHRAVLDQLLEQQQLHLTVMRGDTERLHALYEQLGLDPVSESGGAFATQPNADDADLSPQRMARIAAEVSRVQTVKTQRLEDITCLMSELSAAWAQLGCTAADVKHPQIDALLLATNNTDSNKNDKSNSETPSLPPTAALIHQLHVRKAELEAEVVSRQNAIGQRKNQIQALHKKLRCAEEMVKKFDMECAKRSASSSPLSMDVLNWYAQELASLEATKASQMQSLVFEVRQQLEGVYNELQLSALQKACFKPFQSRIYNDSVLELHERELARATERLQALVPINKEISKWKAMREEVEAFEISSADPARLTKRGSHLILAQEEKLRRKRDVTLPALEVKLLELVEKWERDQGVDHAKVDAGEDAEEDAAGSHSSGSESPLDDPTIRHDGASLRSILIGHIQRREEMKGAKSARRAGIMVEASLNESRVHAPTTPLKSARAHATGLTPSASPPGSGRHHAHSHSHSGSCTPRGRVGPRNTAQAAAAKLAGLRIPSASPGRKVYNTMPNLSTTKPTASTTPAHEKSAASNCGTAAAAASGSKSSRIPGAAPTRNAGKAVLRVPLFSEEASQQGQGASRSILGELRAESNPTATTSKQNDGMSKIAKAPMQPTTPMKEVDVSASFSANTFLSDVAARISACTNDADRLLVYSQSIDSGAASDAQATSTRTPGDGISTPTFAQLSKLHLARSRIYEKMEQDERAEMDLQLSKQFQQKHKNMMTQKKKNEREMQMENMESENSENIAT